MKNFFYLILILSVITACSSKAIPIGLKSTIKQIDQSLNDTIKYDFKIAPEEIATSKHHFGLGLDIRNEKGLWRRSFIRTYFKLNRINHADDMSGIILKTYHRKLNDKPIKFKDQKKYYKEYWKFTKLNEKNFKEWWDTNNSKTERDSLETVYLSYFMKKQKVLGSIGAWTPFENGSSAGTDVEMIGEIIDINNSILKIRITELGSCDEKFQLNNIIGDTIETDIYSVFLIP